MQALLDEFAESKKPLNQPEHKGKWLDKGQSPTKSLIGKSNSVSLLAEMKKASHVHTPSVKKVNNRSVSNNYSLRYVTSPKKSYVVNPKDGEINYKQAYTNFDKFFKKVSNQKVQKYRIAEDTTRRNENKEDKWYKTPNKVESKECTRPVMRLTQKKVEDMGKFLLGKYTEGPAVAVAAKK